MASKRSLLTVLLAGSANLMIALAKLGAGLLAGSSAMLSEAAHSFADTLNQAFLLAALRRSDRPADARHPFGYGMERYFWSLLAAVAIFVLGAGFSIFHGISALVHPREQDHLVLAYGVLAVAFAFDGVSLARAVWHVRQEAPAGNYWRELLHGVEPTVRAVVFEDSAALLGVVVAGLGITFDYWLGTTTYDALASIAIGLLLVAVAYTLGHQNRRLLIGQSVDDDLLDDLRSEIESSPAIDSVVELMTMRLGPSDILLAARVVVDPDSTGDHLARDADDIDQRVRARYPDVKHVFLDPTPA
jgi:cation diffusion facilitator family transporter